MRTSVYVNVCVIDDAFSFSFVAYANELIIQTAFITSNMEEMKLQIIMNYEIVLAKPFSHRFIGSKTERKKNLIIFSFVLF